MTKLIEMTPADIEALDDETLRLLRSTVEEIMLRLDGAFCPRQALGVLRASALRWPDAPFGSRRTPFALCTAIRAWAWSCAGAPETLNSALRLAAPALAAVKQLEPSAHDELARAIADLREARRWPKPQQAARAA